jgi:hypothetical protein
MLCTKLLPPFQEKKAEFFSRMKGKWNHVTQMIFVLSWGVSGMKLLEKAFVLLLGCDWCFPTTYSSR